MNAAIVATPRPETARKLLHVATGVACMPFPWLFAATWPVVGIALAGLAFLVALRTTRLRGSTFARMLHGVDRRSHGDIAFAIGIVTLFVATHERPALYVASLAVATFADAAAALVGVRFGRMRYRVGGGSKTLEGSAAFVAAAFVAVVGGLVAMGAAPGASVAVAGLAAASLLAVVEATIVDGLDNLVLPLATLALLDCMLGGAR